jgi:hypothetical protein
MQLKDRLLFSVKTVNGETTRTNSFLRVVVLVSDTNAATVRLPFQPFDRHFPTPPFLKPVFL